VLFIPHLHLGYLGLNRRDEVKVNRLLEIQRSQVNRHAATHVRLAETPLVTASALALRANAMMAHA